MKRKLLLGFLAILTNLFLLGCSSNEDTFAGDNVKDVIGTWEYSENGNSCYYVFKSNGTGMFASTKFINGSSYVLEHYDFNYTYHLNTKQIELSADVLNGKRRLVLDEVKILTGSELAFRLNGKEFSADYNYSPTLSLEVYSNDLGRKDDNYGVAYSCDKVGGTFVFKIAPLYIWHEDIENDFCINVDNEHPNDVLVAVETMVDNSHLYKIDVHKVWSDSEVGHYLSILAVNGDKTITLSGKLVIYQDGAVCYNPTFVGTWNRLSYDYEKEMGYMFVFRRDGTGMRVSNPNNFIFERKHEEFAYSYDKDVRSLVMQFQNGSEEINDVSFSQNGDTIYGVLQSDLSKIKLLSLDRAVCTLNYKCIDVDPKYDGDNRPVFICDKDSDTTLRFEISPVYYWHDTISENFDIKVTSNDFTDEKSSFSYAEGIPSLLTVVIPKTRYGSHYTLLLEKPWTDLSYNSLTPLSIRSEYIYKPDADKPKPDTGDPAFNPDWEELQADGERYIYCPIKKTKAYVQSWSSARVKAYRSKISGQIIIYYSLDRHYAHIGNNRKGVDRKWHTYTNQFGRPASCCDEEVLEGVIYDKVKEK